MKGAVSVRSSSSGQWSSSSRSVPAEAHRERAEAVHQGVRHLPHLQVSIHVTPVTRHLAILSRSPDTILNKETRLFFLQCMTCHSSCSVQTIKTGFQVIIFFPPSSPPSCPSSRLEFLHIPCAGRHRQEKAAPGQDRLEKEMGGHTASSSYSCYMELLQQTNISNFGILFPVGFAFVCSLSKIKYYLTKRTKRK